VILAAARLFGYLFRWLGQPQVCGEIAAGLILGPSLLGGLAPDLFSRVFTPSATPFFVIMSQVGLILLMLIIGLEFDLSHLAGRGRSAAAISLVGIAVPFGLGLAVGAAIHPYVAEGINPLGFALFIATALSITAMPVLARIMLDLNILKSPIGSIAITAAAANDVLGWTMLTVVASIVRSQFSFGTAALTILEISAWVAFVFFAARPLLKRWAQWTMRVNDGKLSMAAFTVLISVVFVSAVVTNLIGVFSIFGAFLIGAALSDEKELKEAVLIRLRDFTTAFFLPVFFAYTGLRTHAGSLTSPLMWGLCFVILAAAIVGKLGGCTLAARWTGSSWREAFTIGALMNTRGLIELVVINLGYELGVIPLSVFFMLVVMAVVTTYMTTPVVRRAIQSTPLAPLLEASPFMASKRASDAMRGIGS
jgi:Kef-type K+ transport system membrane component KefB